MADTANILIGPGTIYTAPFGEAEPSLDVDTISWAGNWIEVGYTDGGIEVEYTPEVFEAFVDQELGPVRSKLTAEQFIIRVPIAEADLRNHNLAITGSTLTTQAAGGGKPAQDILKFGSGSLVEKALGVEAESPESQADGTQGWRAIFMHRAISLGTVTSAYRKAEKTMVPVEFRALVDDTKPLGERLGKFVDWTSAVV